MDGEVQISSDEIVTYLLVRFSSRKSFSEWTTRTPNHLQLAQDFLDSKKNECSVYRIESIPDKTKIISAHFTVLNRNKIEKVACIEIKGKFLSDAGLELFMTPGRTGIKFVDDRHHDIRGSEDKFVELVKLIVNDYFEGNQPFLGIEPEQMETFIRQFKELSVPDSISLAARTRCLKVLGET